MPILLQAPQEPSSRNTSYWFYKLVNESKPEGASISGENSGYSPEE
jgi:hypothetical protein